MPASLLSHKRAKGDMISLGHMTCLHMGWKRLRLNAFGQWLSAEPTGFKNHSFGPEPLFSSEGIKFDCLKVCRMIYRKYCAW